MPTPPPWPGPGRFIPPDELQSLRRDPLGALHTIAGRYGDLFRYPVGFWTIYVLNDPDAIARVLVDNQSNYSKDTFQYNLLAHVAGNGLLSSDGDFWRRQRRLSQPAFHQARLEGLAGEMVAATERMLEGWVAHARRGTPVGIEQEMLRLAMDILGRALFSHDLSGEAGRLVGAVMTALDHLAYRARNPFAPPTIIPTPRNRRYRAAVRALDEAAHTLIARRRESRAGESDLLSLLLDARDPETGEGMSDSQLRDEIVTLLIAGHETVASALTWAWYLLARTPDAERGLHDEVDRVLHAPPTLESVRALPYTRMVLDETLRLYPPSWILSRRALAADQIGPYTLPAGALVLLSPYLTQRHPGWWEEPARFVPERFASGRGERARLAYFPFGAGPRLCIGRSFSLLEGQLVLATIARRFRLRPLHPAPIAPEPLVTLRPHGGLPMRVEFR